MSPLALQFLRRMTTWALVLAVLLAFGPRVATELGLMGPGVQGEIEAAERAMAAARAYGADESQPALRAAQQELDRSRQLASKGERREARHAALRARARAVEAQRDALASREEHRRRAMQAVQDVDRLLNELEDTYSDATTGLDKPTVNHLLGLMKEARQVGAGLELAFEQGDYAKVLATEKDTRDSLAAVRATLQAAKIAKK
jgi:hypothetical protein